MYKIATVCVSGATAVPIDLKPIPRGITGAVVEFRYDDSIWAGLRKKVAFRGSAETEDICDGSTVTFPAEVAQKKNARVTVGITGVSDDGAVIIPTLWADLGSVRDSAYGNYPAPGEPVPPVWAQLLTMIGDLKNLDTEAKDNLVNAVNEAMTKGGSGGSECEVSDEQIKQAVEEYMAEHPVSGGNVDVDPTLTIEGAAADAKAVGDAISVLSDEIAALKGETTTIVPVSEFLYGGYIRADGTLNSATASMSVYGPIVLKSGDKVSFTAAGIANASAILARANGNAGKPYDVVLTPSVSEEAEAFEYEVAVSGDYYISSIRKYATVTECSVTTGQAENSGNEITTDEVSVSEYLNGGYVRAEGTLNSTTASFSVYGPIALNAGDVVRFTAAGYSTAVAILAVSTGSEDKPYNAVIVSADGDAHEFVYTVIVSGEYYISSVRSKATVSSVLVTTGQTDSKEEVGLSGYRYAVSKVLCIGDSLTNGAYYVGDANGAPITQSYPYYLGRMLNCETTNAGNNGASASDWYNRNISNHTYANYDTIIIWLGTNYGCTAMPTDAEISAFTPDSAAEAKDANQALYLTKIIQTIRAANASCHIVLCTIFASNTDVAANNDVVSQIAEKYGCQLVDMSDLSHKNHIELHAGIRNVHFGKVGNLYIANRLASEISAYIAADPLKGEFGITFRQ